jgi:hypothetical protein
MALHPGLVARDRQQEDQADHRGHGDHLDRATRGSVSWKIAAISPGYVRCRERLFYDSPSAAWRAPA